MKNKKTITTISMLLCCLALTSCRADVLPSSPAETSLPDETLTATSETAPESASGTVASEETTPSGPLLEIDGKVLEGTEPSPELTQEIRQTAEETLREYALFFIYMGSGLEGYVDSESKLHDYLFGSDSYSRIYNEFYNYEYIESWDFSEFDTSDYILFGDDYLTMNVRYKLDIAFSRPDDMSDENQKLDALWTFHNTENGWKLCDSTNNNSGMAEAETSDPDVQIFEFTGKDYDGVALILNDASRLFCGTVPEFAYDYGQTVPEMIWSYENSGYSLSGGINGGNFDDGGTGSSYTAMPLGVVISEGEAVFTEYGYDTLCHLTGFDGSGKLILGNLTLKEALQLGIRDAVYTTEKDGPFLIMDGEIQFSQLTDPAVYGAGKNPRTAIGQRADGSIVMLVINGRQPSSLGASFEDLADIMLEFGAVTASAMDGGTSSQMIWNGSILNHPFSAFGLRMCPTAWLIKDAY